MNYEGGGLLLECVDSLRAQGVLETIVVDNGSVDGSTAVAASEFPDLRVVTPGRNLGFAGGANLGAHQARGGLLLFLNPDVRLPAGSVRTMAGITTDTSTPVPRSSTRTASDRPTTPCLVAQ